MAELVGIDLGTTNTVMAYLDESGEPKIQVNAAGENLTPSAVHIDEQKNVLVGTEAIKQAEFGFRIWTDYKRDIGNDVGNNEKYGTVQEIEITPEFVRRALGFNVENEIIKILDKRIFSSFNIFIKILNEIYVQSIHANKNGISLGL